MGALRGAALGAIAWVLIGLAALGHAHAASRALQGGIPLAGTTGFSVPATLPTVSAPPVLIYGMKRMRTAYTGTAVSVTRVSDGATASIGFDVNGDVDLAAARLFAGGGTTPTPLTFGLLQVTSLSDQSGSAYTATCTNSPWLVSERDANGSLFPDRPMVMFDSQKYAFTNVSQVQKYCTFSGSVSRNSQNIVSLLVTAPQVSFQNNILYSVGSQAGTTRQTVFTDSSGTTQAGDTRSGAFSGAPLPTNVRPRTTMQVIASVSRAAGRTVWLEDVAATNITAGDSQTLTGGGIGLSGTATYWTDQDFVAYVEYPSTITDAEVASIRNTLSQAWRTAKRATRLVVDGSSTPEGTGTVNNASYAHIVQGRLDRSIDVFNTAQYGTSLTTARDQAASKVDPLFLPGARNIVLEDSGANDVLGYTGGTATNDANTLYGVLNTFVQARLNVGWTVGCLTVRDRSDYSAYQEQVRAAYNNLVVANSVGCSFIYDASSLPEAQSPGATYYQQETNGSYIHGNKLRHAADARVLTPILQGFIR